MLVDAGAQTCGLLVHSLGTYGRPGSAPGPCVMELAHQARVRTGPEGQCAETVIVACKNQGACEGPQVSSIPSSFKPS